MTYTVQELTLGGLTPLTIEVMAEIGINISNHSSQHLKEFQGQEFGYVVTLCGNR